MLCSRKIIDFHKKNFFEESKLFTFLLTLSSYHHQYKHVSANKPCIPYDAERKINQNTQAGNIKKSNNSYLSQTSNLYRNTKWNPKYYQYLPIWEKSETLSIPKKNDI